jgi:hypothetical protein
MNYEILTIVLGVWNITLQLRLNSKRKQTQRLIYSLDKIAHKEWRIVETKVGFDVIDHEGDTAMKVSDRSKHE